MAVKDGEAPKLHPENASEGRASSKTTPKNYLTCRLKSEKTSSKEARKKLKTYTFQAAKTLDPPAPNTMAMKGGEATKRRRKSA